MNGEAKNEDNDKILLRTDKHTKARRKNKKL